MNLQGSFPSGQQLNNAFRDLFFRDYKGGSALFVGSILNSLAQMSDDYSWAKEALNDFQYFKVTFEQSTGHMGRDFLESGFDKNNFSSVFPNRDNWNLNDVRMVRHTFSFKNTLIEASFGAHSKHGAFITCQTLEKNPSVSNSDPKYQVMEISDLDGYSEKNWDRLQKESLKDFAHWLPYATLRFAIVITATYSESLAEEEIRSTMFSVSTLITDNFQNFIKKYLVDHVYNGERGITPDNIDTEWGVPKNLLELTKFHSSKIDGTRHTDGTYAYDFQAIGCTPTGVPDIVFDFGFLFTEDKEKAVRILARRLEFLEVDNIKKTLSSIIVKKGSLLEELKVAFLSSLAEPVCVTLMVIHQYYSKKIGNDVHLEDKDHAKEANYSRK